MASRLILIPVGLTSASYPDWLGQPARDQILPLRRFVVEHAKSARQFLKMLGLPLQELELEILDEQSRQADLDRLAGWLGVGGDTGLLSEAGCPAIADPGAALVLRAHQLGIQVVPLIGPTSVVLALMASGLNGQQFAFNGYLPQSGPERDATIRNLENRSGKLGQTEIFIETPYRNDVLFRALTSVCHPDTWLSIAVDLTAPGEWIGTQRIGRWRQSPPLQLNRRPAVFLLLAAARSVHARRTGRNAQ